MTVGPLALGLALAWGSDPAAVEDAPVDDDGTEQPADNDDSSAADPVPFEGIEEITVYAEERVRQARERVVEQLDHLGYDQVEKVGDREVYRHTEAWKGEVVLHDDGWTVVRRQPLRVEGRAMPWTRANTPVAWAGCFLYPWLCIRSGGTTISKAKWRAVEGRTVESMHGDVRQWNDRIADLHTRRKVGRLPDAMEELWDDGQPLEVGLGQDDRGEVLATMAERRQALFAYWDSRTETVWGDDVRRSIEGFCRAVVQRSEHPFSDEELERLNASRTAAEPFDPSRRRP